MTSLVQAADAHRNFARDQQKAFAEQVENVKPGRIICVVDYKAKVILGQSSVQVGHEFYESPMRSLLGFTLFVHPDDFDEVKAAFPLELHGYRVEREVEPEANGGGVNQPAQAPKDNRGKKRGAPQPQPVRKPWKIHFEFVFDIVSQNGWQTIAGIRALFEHPFVRALAPLGFTFWMDNGSHFKNKEVARFFSDCADFEISWNHFAAHHGKNVEDTRFAAVQQFFDEHCNTESGSMRSSAEVVDVIKKGQARINANRVKNEKRPTIAFQQVVQVPQMPQTADILQFPDIRALHCFVIDPATRQVSAYLQTNATVAANIDFEPITVDRTLKTLTVGHPNPLDPASLEHQQLTLKSVTGLQVQRRKLGDDKYVCAAVKQAVPLPGRRPRRRAPPVRRTVQEAPRNRQKRKRDVVPDDDNNGDDDEAEFQPRNKKVRTEEVSGREIATRDDDEAEFQPRNKKVRTEEVPGRQIATRSKGGLAKQTALTTALRVANAAARKTRLNADDRNAIQGLRDVYRSDLRAAGNETATQGSLSETWRLLALAEARKIVWDYEDDREDAMEVDETDAMEVDNEFVAVWPNIPYDR